VRVPESKSATDDDYDDTIAFGSAGARLADSWILLK